MLTMDRVRQFERPGKNEVGSWMGRDCRYVRRIRGGGTRAWRWRTLSRSEENRWNGMVLGLEDGEKDCGSQVKLGRTFQVGTALGLLEANSKRRGARLANERAPIGRSPSGWWLKCLSKPPPKAEGSFQRFPLASRQLRVRHLRGRAVRRAHLADQTPVIIKPLPSVHLLFRLEKPTLLQRAGSWALCHQV